MNEKIEQYINNEFASIGLSRNGGWVDCLSCGDLENIIRNAVNYGINMANEKN